MKPNRLPVSRGEQCHPVKTSTSFGSVFQCGHTQTCTFLRKPSTLRVPLAGKPISKGICAAIPGTLSLVGAIAAYAGDELQSSGGAVENSECWEVLQGG